MSLRTSLRTPATKRRYVQQLFSTIADRYDLITVLLSYGQDRRWKRRVISIAGDLRGRRVLDLACGTGDLARLAVDAGADVIALDLIPRMIELGRGKDDQRGRRLRWLVGDMTALPLPDACVDVVTTGYGLRNVPDLDAAIREIARVLKPGGQLVSLDFDRPASAVVRAAYHAYLTIVGSALGFVLHRDPDTYRYIAESIRLYPGAAAIVDRLRAAGFGAVRWHAVLGGLLAIHHARRV